MATAILAKSISTVPVNYWAAVRPVVIIGQVEPLILADSNSTDQSSQVDRLEVSPVAEAYWSGFGIGAAGFPATGHGHSDHYGPEEVNAFLAGNRDGITRFDEDMEERAEIMAHFWMTEREAVVAGWVASEVMSPNEIIEARGFPCGMPEGGDR